MASQNILEKQIPKYDCKTRKIRLEWIVTKEEIEYVTENLDNKRYIDSPDYKIRVDGDTAVWQIDIVPYPDYPGVSIQLKIDKDFKKSKKIDYELSIKSEDGSLEHQYSRTWDEDKGLDWIEGIFEVDEFETFYVNEKITFVIVATISVEKQDFLQIKNYQDKVDKSEIDARLLKTFVGLHTLTSFSDLVIFCGDQKFLCHKLLLASRSTVFRDLLENAKDGNVGAELEITDTSPDVFKIIIDHINTGEIAEDLLGIEVFKQSIKYNLTDLTKACEVALLERLSPEAALSTLTIIDTYKKDSPIRKDIIKFICMNALSLMATDTWKSFVSDHPDLITEIIHCLVTKEFDPADEALPIVRHEGASKHLLK